MAQGTTSTVYLIPSVLHEQARHTIAPYIIEAVKECRVFFVENERTARRYLKSICKEIVIDDYEWHNVPDALKASDTSDTSDIFREKLKQNKTIAIISEAGCPGVADPGQELVAIAHEKGALVKPLVGPNAILLALMASGMNGQQFQFAGYLPIDNAQRIKAIKELEAESAKKKCTQIFIETPYRNNQLIEALLKSCKPATLLCIAADLTSADEWIKTKTISGWQKNKPDIHKRPAIFCLMA
ncbi:MAG: SAM-dependent methyltransferase [Chitinophagaceae bacterium]|nr:SAM-dependent methyltransferase [Chitinophagaceae bacterium]